MKYNQLGSSTLHVSEIGFGCMSLNPDNDSANASLLRRAVDQGINFFDTADLYDKGKNESSVGKAIKGIRDKVILATKVGNQWRDDGSGWNWNPSGKYIMASVEKSLSRLQCEYIDLYQLHGGTMDDNIDETIEAFELLKRQGKIRYYGISSIRPTVISEYVKRSDISSVMMEYSLVDRRPEEQALELLRQHNIGVLVRGGLAQGLLVNKPPKPMLDLSELQVTQAAQAIATVSGNRRGRAETAIRYILHHPAISSAVIGIRTPKQLEEAIRIGSAPSLTEHDMNILNKAVPANKYKEHRIG